MRTLHDLAASQIAARSCSRRTTKWLRRWIDNAHAFVMRVHFFGICHAIPALWTEMHEHVTKLIAVKTLWSAVLEPCTLIKHHFSRLEVNLFQSWYVRMYNLYWPSSAH